MQTPAPEQGNNAMCWAKTNSTALLKTTKQVASLQALHAKLSPCSPPIWAYHNPQLPLKCRFTSTFPPLQIIQKNIIKKDEGSLIIANDAKIRGGICVGTALNILLEGWTKSWKAWKKDHSDSQPRPAPLLEAPEAAGVHCIVVMERNSKQ